MPCNDCSRQKTCPPCVEDWYERPLPKTLGQVKDTPSDYATNHKDYRMSNTEFEYRIDIDAYVETEGEPHIAHAWQVYVDGSTIATGLTLDRKLSYSRAVRAAERHRKIRQLREEASQRETEVYVYTSEEVAEEAAALPARSLRQGE